MPSLTADICVFAGEGAEKELLLIKRGNEPYKGCWALPGGFADENEPLEETARRELEEETGISGLEVSLVGVYSAPGRDPRGWVVSAAYKAFADKARVKPEAGDDAADAKWFKISEINMDKLAFDHAQIIADALGLPQ